MERLSQLLSSGPVVIYTCETEGEYAATFISENVQSIFGYRPEQFTENPKFWASGIHPEDSARVFAELPQLFEHGTHIHEYRFRLADGKYIWVHDELNLIKDDQGKPIEMIGYWADITQRKKAEAALEESYKELESYSYSIAHDLRSPLRSISGFSQILIEDASERLNSSDQEHLRRIVKAASHMGELIDDILELSRVSLSHVHYKKVNLSAICSEIIKTLSESDTERVVEWRIQPDLVVNGDQHLMYLMLDNLLANAWKFTQYKAHALIEFGSIVENDEKVFFVRDNGVGFDMKYVDKLFGLFQRLHKADEYEGTGVGLATVERVIKRHNGWVRAEGVKGSGATIFFSIPDKG